MPTMNQIGKNMNMDVNIPHLTDIHARPFFELEKKIIDNQIKIESWFRDAWQRHTPVFTSSVDLRNAGFKLGAVDANVFPAGFNNLNAEFFPMCIMAAAQYLNEYYPRCKNILIIPENHTRNPHYYASVANLKKIIEKAGYEVRVGSLLLAETSVDVPLENDEILTLYAVQRIHNKLIADDFSPCLVILNNDLSEGIPDILQNIQQAIEPAAVLGWSVRSKTTHATFYQTICAEFSTLIDIDPWLISPLFLDQQPIDFMKRENIEELMEKTAQLLEQIQQKYVEYHIDLAPYVVVKADAGTYGMGVMPIHHPEQLKILNRKQRNSMATRKGGLPVNHVIIQEGIPTFETIGPHKNVAEPVVYMLGQQVIGGFYRVHQQRNMYENLNSPGMHFQKLSFAACCNNPDARLSSHEAQNQFYVYSVIARLAALAISYEKSALLSQSGDHHDL